MNQMEIVSVDQMIVPNHRYRRFLKVWDFNKVDSLLSQVKSGNLHEGYDLDRVFRCLLLQLLEGLSYRELEVFLQENSAGKWFCGFLLSENTPDDTVFTRARKKIGTPLLSKLFESLRDQQRAQGFMNEVFTFVDTSHLICKYIKKA